MNRTALVLLGPLFIVGACSENPTAPPPAAATAAATAASLVSVSVRAGLSAAFTPSDLVESEAARLEQVLRDVPQAAPLTAALAELGSALGSGNDHGRPLEAAQLVLRRVDDLARTAAGAGISQDLDALRLMLDAFQFEETKGASRDGKPRRLNIW